MNAVEIIALILAIIILVKAIINLSFGKKLEFMMRFAEKIYHRKALISMSTLIIVVIIGYFLLRQLNIVQIFAASMFGILLYALFLFQYPKELMKFVKTVSKKMRQAWLPWLIWGILALWVIYEVLVLSTPK